MEGIVFILLCLAVRAAGYGNGKVTASCTNLTPNHGASPQTTASPFTVSTDKTNYSAGEDIIVRLNSSGSATFEGFLLQARAMGGTSAVGSFTTIPAGTQKLTCQTTNSAVSHSSEDVKKSIQVTWKPASGLSGPVQFHATFVQLKTTYWVDVQSAAVRFPLSNSTTDPHSSTIQPNALPAAPLGISAVDCGVTRVCFREPADCDPAQNSGCYFMSAMLNSPGDTAVHYQLSGPSDGYVSFGFSDDQQMGNDDIYICVLGSNGLVQIQHAFSTGTTTPQTLALGNVTDVKSSVQNGVISCTFTSSNTISTQRSTGTGQSYYLLFAHGPSANGQIQIHTGKFVSGSKVDITQPGIVQTADHPPIIKAHGALMLIAWMGLGSLGMMVARFGKGLAKGHSLCGKDVWFVVHVSVMCMTVAATIIAFILVFSYAQDWAGGAHPVLGCLVMILSLLQPMGALLRCGPQDPKRFIFNWSHALNALAIKGLSVAAIFTGLNLLDSSEDNWMMKVMGGFVCWEALFYLLSDLNLRCSQKSADARVFQGKMGGPVMIGLFLLGNLAFLVALLVGIGKS